MGSGLTWFARHSKAYLRLEEILSDKIDDNINALVVGAGFDYASSQPWSLGKYPFGKYSWEPVEVEIRLEGLGKTSSLMVVDISEEVCEALKKQDELVLPDEISGIPEGEQYIKNFLEHLNDVQELDMELLSRQLSEEIGFGHFYTFPKDLIRIYRGKIPEKIRQKINVVQGDIADREQWIDHIGKFNFISCHQVLYQIEGGQEAAMAILRDLLTPRGILSYSGSQPFTGLNELETIKNFDRRTVTTLYQKP